MFELTFPSAVLLFLSVIVPLWYLTQRNRHPYPPGPKGLPLVGNLLDVPTTQQHVTFAEMDEKYGGGGMVYLSALGQKILVLNDAKRAEDLFEKRGKIYSDRPVLMMAGEIIGWGEGPGLQACNKAWYEYRKILAQFLGTKGRVEGLHELFTTETHTYLKRVLSNPQGWVQHTKDWGGSITLMAAYGYKADQNDWLLKIVDDAMSQFSETCVPGAFLVEFIPALRFVPSWFPGAGWKRKAERYRNNLLNMTTQPYNWVRQRMAAGTAIPCFLTGHLENKSVITEKEERALQWAAAAGIYAAGSDTSVAAIENFVLAMTINTSIQKKVQEEMDRVLGKGVLPTFADRARLPYFQAAFNEAMRLYPLVPLGIPHATAEDDVYDGYFVPKGTTVFGNIWKLMRDPDTYRDPTVFNPERFLGENPEKDPLDYLFGFGRRRCPGILFAQAATWIACASLVASFEILPPVDEDGNFIPPPGNLIDGAVNRPEPFECSITPRPGFEVDTSHDAAHSGSNH